MMYASKILINYNKQFIEYTEDIDLEDNYLTLDILNKYINTDDYFFIFPQENLYVLEIHKKRLETKQELKDRITKQELYNKNYEIFHQKHNRNK